MFDRGLKARTLKASWAVVVVLCASSCGSGSTSNPAAASAPTTNARVAVNQASYHFPDTFIGQMTVSPPFEISVAGSGSLTVTGVTMSNPADFVVTNTASCVGVTIVAGGSSPCALGVRFQPVVPGVRSAQMIVAVSDGSSIAVDVFGSAFAAGSGGGSDSGSGGSGGGAANGGGSGGSFAQAPCVPNQTGNISLSVINTTIFSVRLTLASSAQQVMTLSPGAIQIVALQPGNYTLSGEVPDARNVNFLPSTWAVSNGCDYLLRLLTSAPNP